MRQLSRVRLCDAETGVHKLLKQFGMVPAVKIERAPIGPGMLSKFPYIKLSSWVKYLLDSNLLTKTFVGVDSFRKMEVVLTEFWKRFREVNPMHGVFTVADAGGLNLARAIPFYSHSDEGRSYKHMAIWILSAAGAIGRGTRSYIANGGHKNPLSTNEFGLNFTGGTWSTQFIFGSMLKTVYNKHPDAQEELVKLFAQDCQSLLFDGVSSRDGTKVHMIHIGNKGDLPALCRLGKFTRSYAHVPRQSSSKKSCPGICHLCMAGVEAGPDFHESIPFEDPSPNASWMRTLHLQVPWESLPPLLQGLPLSTQDCISFYVTDIWHNFHLGCSKHWIASSIISLLEMDLPILGGGSVESKFQTLTRMYQGFFRERRVTPFLGEINRETMGFPMSSTCPCGRWSKAMVSTQLMVFMDWFCQTHIVNRTDSELLLSIVTSLRA